MPLMDYLAKGVMQTLSKEDFRRIMNDTLDHMLRVMSRKERMEFIDDMVNNAVSMMLSGLSTDEKAQLLRDMLPKVLSQFSDLPSQLTPSPSTQPSSATAVPVAAATSIVTDTGAPTLSGDDTSGPRAEPSAPHA